MLTFADPLERALQVAPDRPALIDGDVRLSFRQLGDRGTRLAGAARSMGLGAGERVAVLMANGHRYVECYLALPAAGYVLVPLNARLSDAELQYILTDAGVRLLVTDRPVGPIDAMVERVLHVPDEYDEVLARSEPSPLGVGVEASTLAGLFYTGGTTGLAKGVMLTHGNLIANAWNTLTTMGLGPDDRYLVVSPMFHAAGTMAVLACVAMGTCQVTVPAFDPAVVLDIIAAERPTVTLAVPTMLVALLEEQRHRPRDVSSLRLLAHGASPVAVETLRRCRVVFPEATFIHLYGATETAPLATALVNEERHLDDERSRSCGQPVVGNAVRTVDTEGAVVAPGTVGEVCVRGPNVMAGYWNKPEQTADVVRDGWYHTGDLGRLDDEGYLFLVDRAKDMIVTGGENVYSTEVEQALMTHEAVLECAVFGIPDETWGEAVAAVAVTRSPVTPEELRRHCRDLIASFKVPKRIDVIDEPLPKSAAGKILKRELREPFWTGHEARISGA
jgi:long-chain acyl-CoA synthetase